MDETIVEKACAGRLAFEKLAAAHEDDSGFADSINAALEEHGLLPTEKIKAEYEKTVDFSRLLKIGIVGAVKAGKSSLLNALFFDGKDILPKAATPMTAALTELTYGDTCSITVDFFTEADVLELQKKSSEYKRKFSETKEIKLKEMEENWRSMQKRRDPNFTGNPDAQTRKQWEDMAQKGAEMKLKENIRLSGAYEQYQKIQSSSVPRRTESESFTVASVADIAGRLEDYVGSAGKYMPFTSKVSITLPLEGLKGIAVIDTPGFNDPVPSRDDRARMALRECDVIFILSRATPFLGQNDIDVISKITKTNGKRELYIIPSQVDGSLISPEHISDSNGDVHKALEIIKGILTDVAKKNLHRINEDGAFDGLIKEPGARMFLTSGQCESMARTFDNRSNWDSGKKKTWENLCKCYPDYFSDGDTETSLNSLHILGNIDKMHESIEKVKEGKQEIFQQCLEDFGKKYRNVAKAVQDSVLTYIDERETELEKQDIAQIEQEIAKMKRMYEELAPELDDAFMDTVQEWYAEVRADYESRLSDARGEVKTSLQSNEGSYEKTWTTRGGFLWLFKEYHSRTITTVNATAVKNSIADYIDDYNSTLPHYLETEIYRLSKRVVNVIQKLWSEKEISLEEAASGLRNRVRNIMTGMNQSYDLEYSGTGFTGETGRLEGSSAEECIDQANAFVGELNREFKTKLKSAMDDVLKKCQNCNFSKNVLDSHLKQLEKKKSDLDKPKLALENFKRMRKETEAIEC